MNELGVALMGAIAGLTIFLGLPVARIRGVSVVVQGFLNAIATGVLLFLLVEILGHANGVVEESMDGIRSGHPATFILLVAVYVLGMVVGLLGLIMFNRVMGRRLASQRLSSPFARNAGLVGPDSEFVVESRAKKSARPAYEYR